MKKVITIDHVYIRDGSPSSSAPKKGIIYKGFSIAVEDQTVSGSSLDGTDQWYTDGNGSFYWSGAFQVSAVTASAGNSEIAPDPTVSTDGPAPTDTDTSKEVAWHIKDFGIEGIWGETTGSGTTVGILDSGLLETHPEFSNAIDLYSDITQSSKNDVTGHGTHMTGIVGARNNQKIVGVAPGAKVRHYKTVSDISGSNPIFITKALKAILEDDTPKVNVISMSFSFDSADDDMHAQIKALHDKGVVLVAAAGNKFGQNGAQISFPAAFDEVISVAGIKTDGSPDGASTMVAGIDLLAPGFQVLSSNNATDTPFSTDTGSSPATAFVSGVIALLQSKSGNSLTPAQVKTQLQETGLDSGADTFNIKIIQPSKLFGNA